jgi:uracil-DNA glycosylase
MADELIMEDERRLALDERQRGMLAAMGITGVDLWLPTAPVPAKEEKNHPIEPLVGMESAQNATKSVANKQFEGLAPARPVAAPHFTARPSSPTMSLSARPEGIDQMDWPALAQAVSGCRACGLCQSRKNTVFGVGQLPSDAQSAPQVDWLIVGEAPGENEDIQGEPFVGQAGKLLDNMLAAMKLGQEGQESRGLSRQQGVYIANVLKCRPPANRNPAPEEVTMCEPYLARQIELLQPKIILAMGKFAIQSLTGSMEPVGKLRGRVHTLKHARVQVPVIVTYHPAYLLRNLPDKAKAWADLLLAMRTYAALKTA